MTPTIERRNRDLANVYRRLIYDAVDAGYAPCVGELAERVARHPAPAYYVDVLYAYAAVCRLRNGKNTIHGNRLAMWREIEAKASSYQAGHPGASLIEAVMYVVETQTASCFFLTPRSALRILQKIRREERRNLRRKHLRH